jgi:hypothetical protein
MWDKLTVGQFISLYDIETNSNLNIIEKQQKMLSIVEGNDEEFYDDFKYKDLIHTYGEKLAFFDDIPETKPVDYLQVGDNRYKFCYELQEITAGQYIDILSFSGEIMQINKIAACFFLPMQGDKYQGYGVVPHDVIADDLLEANFLEVYSCMLFFCQLFSELISNTIIYSMLNQDLAEKVVDLWKGGGGYLALSRWQTSKISQSMQPMISG